VFRTENGAGFHDYGIRTSQGAVAVASRRSVVTRAPELVGERDVQAVQHAGALAKCVGAPQVSSGGKDGSLRQRGRLVEPVAGGVPGSISPARMSRDSAESISAGWCAGELTSSPAI
jgi:hypothetical protein